jgi:hypothetical protein
MPKRDPQLPRLAQLRRVLRATLVLSACLALAGWFLFRPYPTSNDPHLQALPTGVVALSESDDPLDQHVGFRRRIYTWVAVGADRDEIQRRIAAEHRMSEALAGEVLDLVLRWFN